MLWGLNKDVCLTVYNMCLDVRHYQALCDVSQIDKYEAGNTVSTASLQQPPTDQADLAAGQTLAQLQVRQISTIIGTNE